MPVHDKTASELQAQVAAFADEQVADYYNRTYLMSNIGQIAAGNVVGQVRTGHFSEFVEGENGLKRRMAPREQVIAAREADYVGYLREVGGRRYEPIAGRAECLEAYDNFVPAVDRLLTSLSGDAPHRAHPGFLGAGRSAEAILLSQGGKDYVVRLSLSSKDSTAYNVDHKLRAGVRAKGIPHLEQIVAASYEHDLTIAVRMQGTSFAVLSPQELDEVTEVQLAELITTVRSAAGAGLAIDYNPENFFYDREQGFGITDYEARNPAVSRHSIPELLTQAGEAIFIPESAEGYAHRQDGNRAILTVLHKYVHVLQDYTEGLPGVAGSIPQVEAMIARYERAYTQLSDPTWVQRQVDQARERNDRLSSGVDSWQARKND